MGSQNTKLQIDSVTHKPDNPLLHLNYVNGGHLSGGGSTILKPTYHTNTNFQNFSASTQDNTSKRNSSYAESSTMTSLQNIKNKFLNIINATFRWPFAAQKVFITGSFTNWKNFIPMKKIGQEFEIILQLPPGIYQYKFVVDGEWKYSPEDQTYTDSNSNINNLIDLNNYTFVGVNKTSYVSSNNTLFSHTSVDTYHHSLIEDNHIKQQSQQPQPSQQFSCVENNFEPNFNEEAPPIPIHLLSVYHLNEKEKKKEKYWKNGNYNTDDMDIEDEKEPSLAITGFLKALENKNILSPPEHIDLNRIGSLAKEEEKKYEVLALSQRFKAKYVTLKYYSFKKTVDP